MKPVKHEHVVEVTIPPAVQETVEKTRDHIRQHKINYLYGLGGVVVGVIGMRLFGRRSAVVQVVVQQSPAE